jgi:hypothetical protein
VNVALSNCFINQNIVATYFAVEVQIHAFITAAKVGVVPLASTSHGYLPAEKTTGAHLIRGWA